MSTPNPENSTEVPQIYAAVAEMIEERNLRISNIGDIDSRLKEIEREKDELTKARALEVVRKERIREEAQTALAQLQKLVEA